MIVQRQRFDVAALPADVRHAAAAREVPSALKHRRRPVDRDDPLREPRRFDGEIALAASDVADDEPRHQVRERARPRRPAPARDELAAPRGIRVLLEVFFPEPAHLFQSRVIGAPGGSRACGGERVVQHRPQRAEPVLAALKRRRHAKERERAVAPLFDEAGVFQEPEMAGHAGLGEADDARELGDVEPFGAQQPQDAQPSLVAEDAEDGWDVHIY